MLGFGPYNLGWDSKGDKALKMGLGDGRTYRRTDVKRDRQMDRFLVFFRTLPEKKNRSPKGNMWSAIPVALLCMIVYWNERKQGSGPEVLYNTGGLLFAHLSVRPFICPSVPPGLKSTLSDLKSTLSGLKSALSGL